MCKLTSLIAWVLLFLVACGSSLTLSAVICPGGQIGASNSIPSIVITQAEPSQISGTVQNVDGGADRVVCYAFTDCAYIQPDAVSWGTDICSDGSWSTSTYPWGRLVCMVVDQTFAHPSKVCTSRDTELCELTGVKGCARYPTPRVVSFSQSDWEVKDSSGYFVGPGPNVFSASQDNVSLDASGALHLQAVKSGSQWTSSEIFRAESAGHGTYECRIGSRLDTLDSNVVASCFVYESQTKEIDFIECSPSLIPAPNKCQYVVQPYTTPGNLFRFPVPTPPACSTSTHRLVWASDHIEFMSWCGYDPYPPDPSVVIARWTYTGADIPPAEGRERAHANLWLFNGTAPAGDGIADLLLDSFDVTAMNSVTPTPTPTAIASCVGDCDGDGRVTVDEILTLVNIALGNTPVTMCEAGDTNRDDQITVDEILTAVNNALNGCGG